MKTHLIVSVIYIALIAFISLGEPFSMAQRVTIAFGFAFVNLVTLIFSYANKEYKKL